MINIVLLSHGPFCEGLLKSLEMIAGPQKNLHALQLHEGENPDNYRNQVDQLLSSLTGETMVFIDLKGGTPYNTAASLKQKYEFILISGMNIPILISVVTSRTETTTLEDLTQIALDPKNAGVELIKLTNGGNKRAKLSLNKN
ncbi:PTS mannose transporter subunit IIB [Lacticaseibacillus casei]|jgi:PTS system mannose-specific IIA component|uniref:PTS mannose transporter subunit IIB n=1 Tax=Lacticaseibacillus huelsenbergensis TaxID=3035291 RepID=A0ABY8DP56_9LACO|nr:MULTISPECIES: PTS mannose transporter subunit IIB [Lacticaseibacillus]MDG3061267.1 PTS mannose transporter subunit IIB [Lacticaseibacillus sp. BCRC 81376]QVI38704.1 PTS mannose transporter subunit IIB [Lacticaseibacillus casei]QXG60431.1 PTS mannose transporter subunit IIB [Lacticaseibacillus casei]WFB38013.1 PTS mannose transporter subunit IIB [Lacticaseibacillus huelsenbergensis]WFB42417.1 PTS mannose transporter subunit IIB [Lacticaseibacillus huelsenbergensis]